MERQRVAAQTIWVDAAYSRAVREGNFVWVAGTTAVGPDGEVLAPNNAYRQTLLALGKIEDALVQLGATLQDVVRTRVFLTNIEDWSAVGRAHATCFADTLPASTMVEVSRLLDPELVVEIEADAFVREAGISGGSPD
jgi:enamine deaminase RidA (YjgF/YER057c/UK114 family)